MSSPRIRKGRGAYGESVRPELVLSFYVAGRLLLGLLIGVSPVDPVALVAPVRGWRS
jgi:hypothetical protein